MFLSAVLSLRPESAASLPANLGQATHAWFLGQVRALDPALAAALHTADDLHPFTVSNLLSPGGRYDGMAEHRPDRTLTLRVASTAPALTELLALHWLPFLPERLELDSGAAFRICGASVLTSADGWAGTNSPAQLVEQAQRGDPPDKLALEFASPTVFRSHGQFMPLPLPRLVFEGLARRWAALPACPLVAPDGFLQTVDEGVVISRYRLRTEQVAFLRGGVRVGFPAFVGLCTFALRARNEQIARFVHLLAAFAFYAGVGKHTAMGLGQTRLYV